MPRSYVVLGSYVVSASRRTIVAAAIFGAVPLLAADRFPAAGGDIDITPIVHASVQVEHAGKVIHVDPWRQGDYSHAKRADLILVTDTQSDHLDLEAMQKVRKPDTVIVIPAAAKEKVPEGTVLAYGETKNVAGIDVQAVAAYDIIPGEPFHPKGRANGYILTLGGRRIYFAGVTECVPEVQALRSIDVAFLSMNLPHGRMTMSAAADCVKTFKPRVVYPYHFRNGKVEDFKAALQGEAIDVRLAEWYPGGTGR